MHRARLIVNPTAGSDRAVSLLPRINEKLRTTVERLDITITTDANDAARAGARAVEEGCDAVYVAGGDGTLNAVLRGIVSRDGEAPRLPIGIIPLGTGNDFAKALGLGDQPEQALELLAAADATEVDVGMLNGRPFVNTSAGGFVADVSELTTEGLKDITGRMAYLITGAMALFGSEPFSARLIARDSQGGNVSFDGLDMAMFAICNARFIGGGYPIAPDALIDDGLLDVLIVPAMSRLNFVAVLQRLSAGESHPDVRAFRASSLDLQFSRRVNVNTDGEVLEAERCEYRLAHRAVRFFCGSNHSER